MTILGSRLEESRINKSLSQADIARKIGVTRETVSNWESGDKEPSPEHLRELALVLGVATDYLLGIEKTNTVPVKNLTDEDVKLLHSAIRYMRGKK